MNEHEPPTGPGLFTAVYEGDEDTVVRLLRAGVSPEATDEDGQSVLYLTAVSDAPGITRLLLAAGADPDRLSAGTDSPLSGAACGGHTEVVRALLAAGATPDLEEELGFTALAWAVQRGKTDVVAALLEYGADPNRPTPTGEPPLVAAARRGSPSCVRALLEHGARAREEALAEARRWLTVDVASELRAGLEETYGPGHEVTTHRVSEDGGITVVVELRTGDRTVAGNDQQTGHAEIVRLLESVGVVGGHVQDGLVQGGLVQDARAEGTGVERDRRPAAPGAGPSPTTGPAAEGGRWWSGPPFPDGTRDLPDTPPAG